MLDLRDILVIQCLQLRKSHLWAGVFIPAFYEERLSLPKIVTTTLVDMARLVVNLTTCEYEIFAVDRSIFKIEEIDVLRLRIGTQGELPDLVAKFARKIHEIIWLLLLVLA